MKKHLALTALTGCLAVLSAVAAPDPNAAGVTESTDPARAAEVERHAQALGFRPSTVNASGTEQSGNAKPATHTKHKAHKARHHKSSAAKANPSAGSDTQGTQPKQ